jgi:CRISPR-associated endoribonuclease Cas6
MINGHLYSLLLQLTAMNSVSIPALRGDQIHALFLDLVRQTDAELASRLHDEPDYRPFTVSLLQGATVHNMYSVIRAGQSYWLRITLLDGGALWRRLSEHFLASGNLLLHLDSATFQLTRVLSTPTGEMDGWASFTDWQTLANVPACSHITLHFASPCAFSLGNRKFALFPEPLLVWDSLARTWNRYAPTVLQMDRLTLRAFVTEKVVVSDYDLHTARVVFREYAQKGFEGTCQYQIKAERGDAVQLATLAAFACYAGVGSKTTMGMGQVRADKWRERGEQSEAKGHVREVGLCSR